MVSLLRQTLCRSVGNNLSWSELHDVLLDIEVALKNRPLSYVEDDVQLPVLTPNALLSGHPNQILEEDYQNMDEHELRKRAKYLHRCKDLLWRRWTSKYLKGLRVGYNLKHNTKKLSLQVEDEVIIKSDERNCNKWKLGIVEELIAGRNGIIRVVKLHDGKSHIKQVVQHLYPL